MPPGWCQGRFIVSFHGVMLSPAPGAGMQSPLGHSTVAIPQLGAVIHDGIPCPTGLGVTGSAVATDVVRPIPPEDRQ